MSEESASLRVPDHVPPGRVRDFDMYHFPDGKQGLMECTAEIVGNEAPQVFYTPWNGGHWVIAGYESLSNASKDTDIFSSRPYTIPTYDEALLKPILLDPPEHGIYRDVLNGFFTPRAALNMAQQIRSSAIELIDAISEHDRCDFVEAMSGLLPVTVFLDLLGLPLEKLGDYRRAVKTIVGNADLEAKRKAAAWVEEELSSAIADRQWVPREDLISAMLGVEIKGRKPTAADMLNLCTNLFQAGLDSVTGSMSWGIRHLAENPALQDWARANPNKIRELTEELLRRYSVNQTARTVTRDVEFDGVSFRKGDRVLLLIAGANIDPTIFDDPLQVDPGRTKRPNLAFGAGPHRCVGAHLARTELQIAYEEWLKRIPRFRLDAEKPPVYNGGHVFAINHLWLRWD
jgi:cytochrome P450